MSCSDLDPARLRRTMALQYSRCSATSTPNLDASGVIVRVEPGGHHQAGTGGGGGNVVEDQIEGLQRAARPIAADLAEEAMFDRIPLGASSRIGGHGDGELVEIAEMVLEGVLPSAATVGIAAAAIGEQDELGGIGIAGTAIAAPPGIEVVDGEEGGVGGDADRDEAAVGERVVDAVGGGESGSMRTEVVGVDGDGGRFPADAVVAEASD